MTLRASYVALAALLSVAAAAQAASYSLTPVGLLPGGTFSAGTALGADGSVVGYADVVTGTDEFGSPITEQHAILYVNGTLTDIHNPAYGSTNAWAINPSGQIVGTGQMGGRIMHGFLYSGGTTTDLAAPNALRTNANAINASGLIAGSALVSDPSAPADQPSMYTHAYVYDGAFHDLGAFSGGYSEALSINDLGQIVGRSTVLDEATGGTAQHAFLYDPAFLNGSHLRDLGLLEGGTFTTALAINNAGTVLGYGDSYGTQVSFLWNNGTFTLLPTLGTLDDVTGLNSFGQVVGNASLPNGETHPVLWENGQAIDLSARLLNADGWTFTSANAINDAGQILVYGTAPDGSVQAAVLTPVPLPAALPAGAALLLAVGGLSLARRRCR